MRLLSLLSFRLYGDISKNYGLINVSVYLYKRFPRVNNKSGFTLNFYDTNLRSCVVTMFALFNMRNIFHKNTGA
jgi:hypothetical protein